MTQDPQAGSLDPAAKVELLIVASGARRDMGQAEAAVVSLQVAALEPVNVVVRVVYNTLDGIVNDYFVITASVANR